MFNRKAKPATSNEMEYMRKAKLSGCVCCRAWQDLRGLPGTGMLVEFNHHVIAGKRLGRDVGSAECLWHHRGICLPRHTPAMMTKLYGPARSRGSKPFRGIFGSDEFLDHKTENAVDHLFEEPA
jgi:hypothetical protein